MRLFKFENNQEPFPKWVKKSIAAFKKTMLDEVNPFPCYFAKQGLENSNFRLTYINKEELVSPKVFKEALVEYLKIYKTIQWPSVLVTFIETDQENSLENHEQAFWNILQYLNNEDDMPWPENTPKDTNHHQWQFNFQGTAIFVNGHSSEYKKRISRSSKSDMMMVIQTMDTLKPVSGTSKRSDKIRKTIRERINKYDKIEVSNLLGSYPSEDSKEWKQFWLPDENVDKSGCPLHIK
ncbi:YqcI/YcgG family protein [Flaviramulus aquimarinus]|uniref:YqcI/YcgG family protein n=1 Tax=Flaviramulus aquimarinus TaxID=1170456 RepID=A0ABP9EM49_9FLAO